MVSKNLKNILNLQFNKNIISLKIHNQIDKYQLLFDYYK